MLVMRLMGLQRMATRRSATARFAMKMKVAEWKRLSLTTTARTHMLPSNAKIITDPYAREKMTTMYGGCLISGRNKESVVFILLLLLSEVVVVAENGVVVR